MGRGVADVPQLLGVANVPEGPQTLARTQLAFIDLQKGNLQQAIDAAKPIFVFHDKPNTQPINIALEALERKQKSSTKR